jgi:hypothetical protein
MREECKREEDREKGNENMLTEKKEHLIEMDSDDEMRDLVNNINNPNDTNAEN